MLENVAAHACAETLVTICHGPKPAQNPAILRFWLPKLRQLLTMFAGEITAATEARLVLFIFFLLSPLSLNLPLPVNLAQERRGEGEGRQN